MSKGKILKIERLNNSYYGNPRFKLVVFINGELLIMKTEPDGIIGYKMSCDFENKTVNLEFHRTKCGNYWVTDIAA